MAKRDNEKSETQTVSKGDKVHLVLCRGSHVDATVDRVHADGRVDLTAAGKNGTEIIITFSPRDDGGLLTDSWHPIEAAPVPAIPTPTIN